MSKYGKSKQKRKMQLLPGFGWTLFFGVFCFTCYAHAIDKKEEAYDDLLLKIQKLEEIKQNALEEREDLVLQISSQTDGGWIELVLKKQLGVVPEGQMKVYFK